MRPYRYAIALTGGIATGKSTVASLLKLHGIQVIDADCIAHELLDLYHEKIADMFGEEFVRKGKVLRTSLGKVIFNDDSKKRELESFIHPLIREEIKKRAVVYDKREFPYMIDIPLFFENEAYDIEHSVVVYAPLKTQLERYMKRDKIENRDALSRINSQMDIEEKKERATWIIDNSLNLKHLQAEVEKFVDMLKIDNNYAQRYKGLQ